LSLGGGVGSGRTGVVGRGVVGVRHVDRGGSRPFYICSFDAQCLEEIVENPNCKTRSGFPKANDARYECYEASV
jgi:hypothetical protein